jgi:hypothetical protein
MFNPIRALSNAWFGLTDPWIQRQWRRYHGELRLIGDRLAHWRKGEVVVSIGHDEITRVELYKIDMLTTDSIACDITFEDGRVWTIHEEFHGWKEALPWVESLPGFRMGWQADVIHPPFAECRQVVFIRGQRVY